MNRGFAELGFGRFGDATPLSETVALKLFDTNVPQVLESLRAAQQPDSCREVRLFMYIACEMCEATTAVSAEVSGKSASYAMHHELDFLTLQAFTLCTHLACCVW